MENGNIRKFFLVTLTHCEKDTRAHVSSCIIVKRFLDLFKCSLIVIATEKHQNLGDHVHIAVENLNASRYTLNKKIRRAFSEFEGRQCNISVHKGLHSLIGYVTKLDNDPFVWGRLTQQQVLEMGTKAREKRKIPVKKPGVLELLKDIQQADSWLDLYNIETVSKRILYGSHSNVKRIYEDLKIKNLQKRNFLSELEKYFVANEIGQFEEYSPEEIREKYILLDWIAVNLLCERPLKTKQLLVYGPPSSQKTLMFHILKKVLRIYYVGTRLNDFSGVDDFYDLWVFDEFQNFERRDYNGNFEFSENATFFNNTMLRILDGQEVKLDAKFSNVFEKKRNVPIIILANKIPYLMRKIGPWQERFLRLRFSYNNSVINEERLICTFYFCVQRRLNSYFAIQYQKTLLVYNQIMLKSSNNFLHEWKKTQEEKEKYSQDMGVYFLSYAEVDKRPLPLAYFPHLNTFKLLSFIDSKEDLTSILVYPDLSIKPVDLIDFAIIPIKESYPKNALSHISPWNSKKEGAVFSIFRFKEYKHCISWPIRMDHEQFGGPLCTKYYPNFSLTQSHFEEEEEEEEEEKEDLAGEKGKKIKISIGIISDRNKNARDFEESFNWSDQD